jgi:hypothetical protein
MVKTMKAKRRYIPLRILVIRIYVTVVIYCVVFLSLYITNNKKMGDSVRQYTVETNVMPVLVVHQSVCNEGSTSNITRTSLYSSEGQRRRGEYQQYSHLEQILEGPAMKILHFDKAICKFRQITYWEHFPHTCV